jgi:hypothetical protein
MVVAECIAYPAVRLQAPGSRLQVRDEMTVKKRTSAKSKTKKTAARSKKSATAPKKATAKKAAAKKATAKKVVAKKVAAKKVAAAPKKAAAKKVAAAPKKAAAKKVAAAPKKAAAKKVAAKKVAAKKVVADAPAKKTESARPSERAMAVATQLPKERPLTDEEREAMAKVAQTALAALETDGVPEIIVTRIGTYVDEIRTGQRPEPNSQDVRLGLGVLWGEQVRAQVGWRWVHLSYPNGFASYALVPDDRAFACFPLNRLAELMSAGAEVVNTSVPLFDSIRVGSLPARRENAYLVIG